MSNWHRRRGDLSGLCSRDFRARSIRAMKIPIGKTYIAHAICAFVALAGGALDGLLHTRRIDSTSAGGAGMALGMLAVIPLGVALVTATYSAISVAVTLRRQQAVPRDMLLLPAGLVVGFFGGNAFPGTEAAHYILLLVYVVLTVTLVVRHLRRHRRTASA